MAEQRELPGICKPASDRLAVHWWLPPQIRPAAVSQPAEAGSILIEQPMSSTCPSLGALGTAKPADGAALDAQDVELLQEHELVVDAEEEASDEDAVLSSMLEQQRLAPDESTVRQIRNLKHFITVLVHLRAFDRALPRSDCCLQRCLASPPGMYVPETADSLPLGRA